MHVLPGNSLDGCYLHNHKNVLKVRVVHKQDDAEERDRYLSLPKIIAYDRHLDAIPATTCGVQGRAGPALGALYDQHPDRTGKCQSADALTVGPIEINMFGRVGYGQNVGGGRQRRW